MYSRSFVSLFICCTVLLGAYIKFEIGSTYNDSFKIMGKTIHTTPQIAAWIESSKGEFVKTLMVTRKSSKGKYAGHRGGREESLPVWSFARNVIDKKGRTAPTKKTALPDAVTGASKKSDFDWQVEIEDHYYSGGYRLCIEVNNSMDFNDYYREDLPKEDPFYNNKVNGQPSLVFKGDLGDNETECTLVGYGDAAGNNGEIHAVDSTLTTALDIIKSINLIRKGE